VAWRPHSRVKVSARSPRAAARCDDCGFLYNHQDLRWQYQWSGLQLINLKFLKCSRCLDIPQPQLKSKILGPDPLPIWNARPEPFTTTGYSYDESNIMTQPDPTSPYGTNVDGAQMLMPDGATSMMMPDNVGATTASGGSGDFSSDFSSDFS